MTLRRAVRNWGPSRGPRARVQVAMAGSAGVTNKSATIAMAAMLVSDGGWTLVRSCNSLAVATVDNWLSTADVVGNTDGNAHSWKEWTGPWGGLVMNKDSTSDGGGGAPGRLYWSPGNLFTGGSVTNRPTATDEQLISSASTLFSTTNGTHDMYVWRCDTVGQESMLWLNLHSSEATGPDGWLYFGKVASGPAAWSSKIIARFHSGGNGNAGARTEWQTSHGWCGKPSATMRTDILSAGDAPPSALDLDGDRIICPQRLTQTADNLLGFVDDWHFVHSSVAHKTTFSSEDGAAEWINMGGSVLPWGNFAALGGANVAGAKLLVNYLPTGDVTAPTVTLVSSATPRDGDPVVYDVTDLSPGVRIAAAFLQWNGDVVRQVIYDITGAASGWRVEVVAIANGYRFTIYPPLEGWRGRQFRLFVRAVDAAGNLS